MTKQAERESRKAEVAPGDVLARTFDDLKDELLSTLIYVLGNKDDAQDAAQDAFVKCWNARDKVGEITNLRAWIFRVVFNTAKDFQRSAWKRKARALKAEQFTMIGKELAVEETLEHREEISRLRQAIRELREEEKEVFLLRQNGEMTYEQIAELRQCPVGTVKTQMRSALDKLRKLLV